MEVLLVSRHWERRALVESHHCPSSIHPSIHPLQNKGMGKLSTDPKRRAEGSDWLLMVMTGSGSDIGEPLLLGMMKGNFLVDSNEDQFPQLLPLRWLWGEFVKWHLSHRKQGLTGEICAVFVHYLAEIDIFFRRWHVEKRRWKIYFFPLLNKNRMYLLFQSWLQGCLRISCFLNLNCICWISHFCFLKDSR